jgi:ankyrin repeat protein
MELNLLPEFDDIKVQNLRGKTALHIACMNSNNALCKAILKHEQRIVSDISESLLTVEDKSKRVPLYYAKTYDITKTVLRFEAHYTGLPFPPSTNALRISELLRWGNRYGKTPMMGIIEHMSNDMITWFFDRYEIDVM